MLDGGQGVRGEVHGGLTRFEARHLNMNGMVRNLGDPASTEHGTAAGLNQAAECEGRSFLARLISRQADKVALAFRIMAWGEPVSDLDERLRRSEVKKRQLQRRIDDLLGRR